MSGLEPESSGLVVVLVTSNVTLPCLNKQQC